MGSICRFIVARGTHAFALEPFRAQPPERGGPHSRFESHLEFASPARPQWSIGNKGARDAHSIPDICGLCRESISERCTTCVSQPVRVFAGHTSPEGILDHHHRRRQTFGLGADDGRHRAECVHGHDGELQPRS